MRRLLHPIQALALAALLISPTTARSQCSGPLLAPANVDCRIGEACGLPITLTSHGAQVASATATVTTQGTCSSPCQAGAAAPGATCMVNDANCRFNVADLSAPVSAFGDGTIASIPLNCSQLGQHLVTLSAPSFGNTGGQSVSGCTATGVMNCNPASLCFAAAAGGGVFTGAMTTGTQFTGGADLDPAADSLASSLVFANSTTNSANGGSNDKVTYTVTLPSSGAWNLWGRFYYPSAPGSNGANSFFAKVDTGTRKKFGNNLNSFRIWHWDGEGNIENDPLAPLPLGSLSAGQHQLVIEKREVTPTPPRLDALCLTKDSTPPSDGVVCDSIPGCSTGTTTTSTSTTTTTTSTTTTTAPPAPDFVCVKGGGTSPAGAFNGAMTTGTQFTGGADLDPAANNLTTPLVFANSTTNSPNGGSADRVSYSVVLPSSGSWFLWGRFYYPDAAGSNGANSFFARVGNAARQKFGNHLSFFRVWHWDGEGQVETGPRTGLPLGTLAAGAHVITIEKREVTPTPPRLDVFCLTKDGSTPPADSTACQVLGGCP